VLPRRYYALALCTRYAQCAHSLIALRCFPVAPLLIGTDLHEATNETIAILGAVELIAIDQDSLGFQGRVVASFPSFPPSSSSSSEDGPLGLDVTAEPSFQVYAKKLADKSVGVLLLNRAETAQDITVTFTDAWWSAPGAVVRDLWAEKDLGTFSRSYTAKAVPAHGTAALRLT
jgi:hypothetical protein